MQNNWVRQPDAGHLVHYGIALLQNSIDAGLQAKVIRGQNIRPIEQKQIGYNALMGKDIMWR